jgi:hypothetical protein
MPDENNGRRDEAKNPTTVDELLGRMESQSLGEGSTAGYTTKERLHSKEQR